VVGLGMFAVLFLLADLDNEGEHRRTRHRIVNHCPALCRRYVFVVRKVR
jgi:hypothetical protein